MKLRLLGYPSSTPQMNLMEHRLLHQQLNHWKKVNVKSLSWLVMNVKRYLVKSHVINFFSGTLFGELRPAL